MRESLFSLSFVLRALLHQSSSFFVLASMGKTSRRTGPKAVAMKKVKKGAKKPKVMSRGSLSVAIAEKEYQDTIQQINIFLSKKKTLASRVLHMLKTNMLEPDEEPEDFNKLPGCVNKYKILSLENLRELVKVISQKVEKVDKRVIEAFMGIKTKTAALQVFVMWMKVMDNSALFSRTMSILGDWCVHRATDNIEMINNTTFVSNGKQGRFASNVGAFGQCGVFRYVDLNEGVYEGMLHVPSNTKNQLEELKPTEKWSIEDNFNEFTATCKGPRGRHQCVTMFETDESTDADPKYSIPMPMYLSAVPNEGGGQPSIIAPAAKSHSGPKRRLQRRSSAASSAVSEPDGEGVAK